MNERSRIDADSGRDVLYRYRLDMLTRNAALRELEECVVPDPRIARIEALCDNHEGVFGDGVVDTDELRAILAGGDV